jgi:hypothetical protein
VRASNPRPSALMLTGATQTGPRPEPRPRAVPDRSRALIFTRQSQILSPETRCEGLHPAPVGPPPPRLPDGPDSYRHHHLLGARHLTHSQVEVTGWRQVPCCPRDVGLAPRVEAPPPGVRPFCGATSRGLPPGEQRPTASHNTHADACKEPPPASSAVGGRFCLSLSGPRSAAPNSPTHHRAAHTRDDVCCGRLVWGREVMMPLWRRCDHHRETARTSPTRTSASTPGGLGTRASPCLVTTSARCATVAARCASTDQRRSPGRRPAGTTEPPRTSTPSQGDRRTPRARLGAGSARLIVTAAGG